MRTEWGAHGGGGEGLAPDGGGSAHPGIQGPAHLQSSREPRRPAASPWGTEMLSCGSGIAPSLGTRCSPDPPGSALGSSFGNASSGRGRQTSRARGGLPAAPPNCKPGAYKLFTNGGGQRQRLAGGSVMPTSLGHTSRSSSVFPSGFAEGRSHTWLRPGNKADPRPRQGAPGNTRESLPGAHKNRNRPCFGPASLPSE